MRFRTRLASALGFLVALLPLSHAAAVPSSASFYVHSLPDLHQDSLSQPLKIFAGHVSSDPNARMAGPTDVTAHLYFIMIKNRRVADKERLMFWFNGGPGCSSFDGLMMENGPWRFGDDGQLHTADGGWEEYTTMVYVDQPAGTGYSYTSTNHYAHTLSDAAIQVTEFLRNFFDIFPEYRNVDTYLGGESFAGQYIPYFADAILNSDLKMSLRGVAIGNGWMDARRQYPSYLPYAVKHGLIEENSQVWEETKKATDACVKQMSRASKLEPINIGSCEDIMNVILSTAPKGPNGQDMCMNMYDVRLTDTSPSCGMNWPNEIKNVTKYLDRTDVVRALHATAHPGAWQECGGPVRQEFQENRSNSSILILPSVIERIPVLIFAGDRDLICNYMGLESMIQAMTWGGQTGFGTVETQSWTVNGAPAGTWVNSRNLTYAKIFNASHMAPYDAPHVAHDMILRFMGVNFTAVLDGSTRISSSIGSETKPVLQEDDKSAANGADSSHSDIDPDEEKKAAKLDRTSALILLIILTFVALFFWWRYKKRNPKAGVHLRQERHEEEIPLTTNGYSETDRGRQHQRSGSRKGKERALEDSSEHVDSNEYKDQDEGGGGSGSDSGQLVFDVGSDSEDEKPRRRS